MAVMFRGTNAGTPSVFDQDISNWDVRKVTNMSDMFLDSRFNQDISSWTLEATTNMRRMFFRAQGFNQNLGVWNIAQVTNMDQMFDGSGLTPQNYDQTLIGWAPQVDDTTPDITFGASGLTFCKSATARQSLIDNGWAINDANTQVCLDETDLISFKIPQLQATDEVVNTTDHTVTLSVIQSADITDLTPIIGLSPGATAVPASNMVQDFTAPINYTVTAEDDTTTQDWTVTITQETVALTGSDILTFDLAENSPGIDSVVSIDLDEINHVITLNLIPFGSLTNIIPELTISQGATISPLSGESINLGTSSFTYTVTAEDGTTTQDWVVNTNILPSAETDITALTITGQIGETEINSNLHEITLKYPFVLGIDGLTPTIEVSREATIDPLSGAASDFTLSGTNSVEYTVTAQDGTTTQVWTVKLIPARNETDITFFELDEESPEADLVVDVAIDTIDHTITLTLEPFSEPESIVATTELSPGATISPADGESIDISTGSATYTVTAEDRITTQNWTVNTDVLSSTEAEILSFELPGQVGEAFIDDDNYDITLFFSAGSDLTALTPAIEVSRAATVVPESGQAQNFSTDVVYTVTAQDGVTTQDWTVSAIIQSPFITSWNSSGGDLNISINEREDYDFNFIWKNSNGQIVSFGRHNSDEDFITNLPAGEFTLEIIGTFPHFTGYPKEQLLDVNQWGDIIWVSMRESFRNWTGVDFSASDTPDLSQGPDMFRAFSDNPNFNADLSDWNMSQIRTLQGLFNTCPSFNSDISNWNVSNVTNMESTFIGSGFNGDISEWNVSNVTRMVNTFRDATNFDQDISGWDFSNVSNMSNMLSNSGMSIQHYDKFLISLATQEVRDEVTLGASGLNSCLSSDAKDQLIDLNDWTIQDNGLQCSSETDIVTFDIPGSQIVDAVIDTANHTVLSIVLNSADLSELTPEITTSADASLIPASGIVQDFTNPVVYEVIASDSTSQTWTVTVTNSENASDETDILTFNSGSNEVAETTIDTASHEIILKLIAGGNLTSITPEFTVSLGATASPSSNETIDLSAGSATYTVTAEDQVTTQDWTVSVILNNDTDITGFDLTGVLSSVKIDREIHTIDVLAVEGTNITSLLTEVTITEGASISPQAITIQDFTNPITYTVTAEDGVTTQEWIVTVQLVRPFITRWQPEIDEDEGDDSFLFIGFDNDFDYDFSYQWKDENGDVIESGSLTTDDEELFSTFPNENEFTLEIIGAFPYLTDYFEPSLIDVLQWGDIEWRSFESTFRNWPGEAFSAEDTPDLRQVTSMRTMFRQAGSFNGDVNDWDISNVTDIAGIFNEASSFAGDVSQWQVGNVTDMQGAFNGTQFNGDLSNWNVDNVTNMINMFLNASLFDQDLSSWNIGQVTSMEGMLSGSGMSTQNYDKFLISIAAQTVQPNVTLSATGIGHCFGANAVTQLETNNGWTIDDEGAICSSANDIVAIDVVGLRIGDAAIDTAAHTAEVTVINSAELTALSPVITLSDGAIFSATSPQSGQEIDFSQSETSPIEYEVLSSDSTFQIWTVTIINAVNPLTDTDILSFTPGVGNSVTIDPDAHQITFNAVITPEFLITPEFTLSQGASSSPASEVEIDLTDSTETYTVTAEDGITTQDWTVTVNDLKPINDLCINAIAVSTDTTFVASSANATSDAAITPICGSNRNIGNGVWYKIVGNGESITINTCGGQTNFDTALSLYGGSCEDGLICLAGNDDDCGTRSVLEFNSAVGEEYLVLVDGFGSTTTGRFELEISSEPTPELPANDDCETAQLLTVFANGEGTPINGNNTNAAFFSGQVSCDNFGAINDVWFTFNSGQNTRVEIRLNGTDTDGEGPLRAASSFRLAAYEECGGNSIICDTNADGLTNLDVTPNTEYRLQVWNDDVSDQGTFTILVNDGPNTPAVLFFDNVGIGTASISRSTENGAVIDSLIAQDPQGHEQITSLIGDNEEGIFAYDDITRQITIADAAALQASSTTSFDLTFRSADQGPGQLTSEITLTVNIIDNAPPIFNVTTFAVNENVADGSVIGTLSVSDPDGDIVNIVGFNSQDGVISVNPLTRDLIVAEASAFDFERNNSFSLQVTIEDVAIASLQTTENITVNITDVNEAPLVAEAT
ncbi:MAG: BspA family leucine-rich repeat surface protein, partial [Bacteroidota bacterium]